MPKEGAAYGAPRYSIDAAGQETFYAYDQSGHTILQYVYKQWTTDAGATVSGWVGTTSVYDAAGRLTDTYANTYLENSTDEALSDHILPVVEGGPAGIQVDTSVDPVYSSVWTQHIDYNALGQKADTADQYGLAAVTPTNPLTAADETVYTYDANSSVIEQVNPDGTEQLSVYDALNRVIWQTNSFDPDNLSTAITTRTVYNQLGQTTETQQYAGQLVQVGTKMLGSSVTATTSVATVDGTADGVPSLGTLISTMRTFYDPQGNAIETIGANGLRTGSIYTPDGKVLYTGPLAADAPDGGHAVTIDGGVTTQAYTTADFDYYSESDPVQYDDALGLFYTRSVDEDGNATETYTDSQGRTVRTVYADGSFTETLYSVGTTPVSADAEGDAVPTPDGWTGITGGGYEVVNVAQRKATDTPVYSYDLYNAAGHLTDVWLAKVVDNGPNATTGQTPVNPHWHYTYDTAGNETAQISGNGNAASPNPSALQAEFTTSWAYDQNGDKVRQQLPDGELQTWTYDVYGNNTSHKVYSASDHTTALQTTLDTYDTSAAHGGRLLEEDRTSSDPSVTPERTTYTYDDSTTLPPAEQTDQGNLAEVDDYLVPANGTPQLIDSTHYTYDPISGNEATITTAGLVAGGTTVQTYGTINYVYDEATGNLIETWTGTDHSAAQNDVLYGYDSQGRLESVTQVVLNGSTPPGVSGGTRYDADGNPVQTSDPTTVYTYDAAGNMLSDAEPNGDTTTYAYNNLEQITDESITNAAGYLLFGEHTDWTDDGQKQDVVDTRGDGAGNVTSQITYDWTYDNDDRLAGETLTVQSGSGSDVPPAYADTYNYDLDNNRVGKVVDGGALATGGSTISYAYNGDDQLITEIGTGTLTYQTTSTYDANGNLSAQVTTGDNAEDDSYGYDLQNDMTSATVNDVTTNYTYDADGVLTSETTGGATTYDLNDPNNPTGNSKAIQQSSTPGGAPTTSYVLGLQVEAQSDPTRGGTLYLLVDGHGSTRALAGASGAVTSGQTFDYDAFGDQLTNVGTADTDWLYGSGGVYDQSTGWTYNLARWLDGFTFTSSDTYGGSTDDPAGLNKYDYADADPMAGDDPTGHILDTLAAASEEAGAEGGEAGSAIAFGNAAESSLEQSIDAFEGVESGIANMDMVGPNANQAGAFAVGFASGDITESLKFAGLSCQVATGVGGAIQNFGDDYLDNGSAAFSLGGVAEAIGAGLVAGLTATGCFTASTPVLLGDGATEQSIGSIQVGERVATDGGVANSPTGTAAADPNSTEVDPTTWREVTIDAADGFQIETLEPLSWIAANSVTVGGSLHLDDVADLNEMGVPDNIDGTVESISACPTIQSGPGRVVLTTVSHLSTDLYELTLTNSSGQSETLDVTGTHPFYDQSAGWTEVQNLYDGETLRGDSGNLTVTSVVIDPGTDRVYNMDVEGDHVYYVGDLQALVHNQCKHVDGGEATPEQALSGAADWLGPGYRDMGKGRFLSADGLRQFRMGLDELVKSVEQHVHFEQLDGLGNITESNWVKLI